MRKISLGPVLVFLLILVAIATLGIGTTLVSLNGVALGDFSGVVHVTVAAVLCYLFAFLIYRAFFAVMPVSEGSIDEGSREEFGYHLYLLFYLALFQPLTRSRFIPVPVMRLVYLALGARLGENSYCGGTILDPPLTRVGYNTLIGEDALLYSHAIEGRHLSHAFIDIGNNVTIGARSIIMSGVKIGDGAIVAAGAVVLKGTHIKAGEVWGGVPARRLRRAKVEEDRK